MAARIRTASPAQLTLAGMVALFVLLAAAYGGQEVAQRSVNGLVTGAYFALGAVGLTLLYGVLRLVNFAHGDFLTLGAYVAFAVNVTLGVPLIVAVLAGIAAVALLGVLLEQTILQRMRAKRAGMLQLLLVMIGVAFLLRNAIQMVAGTSPRSLDVNTTASVEVLGIRIGQAELVALVVGLVVLLAVGLALRYTRIGQIMRAVADDRSLAEMTGIATHRVIVGTWVFAGGLAGLAGVLFASALGNMTPNLGFLLMLSLFAAVLLGGIGNVYGALFGGLIIGLAQEWSTLLVDSRWKVAVGFVVLIAVLIARPQGLLVNERRV